LRGRKENTTGGGKERSRNYIWAGLPIVRAQFSFALTGWRYKIGKKRGRSGEVSANGSSCAKCRQSRRERRLASVKELDHGTKPNARRLSGSQGPLESHHILRRRDNGGPRRCQLPIGQKGRSIEASSVVMRAVSSRRDGKKRSVRLLQDTHASEGLAERTTIPPVNALWGVTERRREAFKSKKSRA